METHTFIITKEESNQRVDKFLVNSFSCLSRSQISKLFNNYNVLVNSKKISKSYKLKERDTLLVSLSLDTLDNPKAENIPLEIIYEDSDIAVINKPKGMVVHPAHSNEDGTLVNALLYKFPNDLSDFAGSNRPGIVHRIDKDTSGLLVIAKNNIAHENLSKQLQNKEIMRQYYTIVHGIIEEKVGAIRSYIERDPKTRIKMKVTANTGARVAITHYEVLEYFDKFTYLTATLETGRTHQIRAQFASIGHNVAGDLVYSKSKPITELKGQCLHAGHIVFTHPITGEKMDFTSNLPNYFVNFKNKLANK